ncbi:hypothetical protein BdWA1_002291 [Babesia duncani]|uniref:Uncharacterized protein n=1 Tax=Babesia duncani TaxID=323732 RepID=A0AAD9UN45_9APIC|nr:hypothetical protein BdWA1_002291 [Babesia duncani]
MSSGEADRRRVALNIATLYDVFQRMGAIDEFFSPRRTLRDSINFENVRRLSLEDDEATTTTLDSIKYGDSIDNIPVEPPKISHEAQIEELRRDHNLDKLTEYSKLVCGASPDPYGISNLADSIPKFAKRLKVVNWLKRCMAPAITSVASDLGEALKCYLLPPIPQFPTQLVSSVRLIAIQYALIKDMQTRVVFKLENDGVVNERKLQYMLDEIRTITGPYSVGLGNESINFKHFCQIFGNYLSTFESEYRKIKSACTMEERYQNAVISELVERNTYGLSTRRLNEFTTKHCLLKFNYLIEPPIQLG